MKTIHIPNTDLDVSRISLGCMRISEKSVDETEELVRTALEEGINFFDHADIYGRGKSETVFGEVLKRHPEWRSRMILQSKCGIVPAGTERRSFNSSKEYILDSVHKILERLHTDHLDILLIHRIDVLADPKEIAEAFDELKEQGLVHYFGVSNYTPSSMQLLQKYLHQPIVVDQLQLSITHSLIIDSAYFSDMRGDDAIVRDTGLLDYCRLNDISVQAWSPLQASWEEVTFINNPGYPKLNARLQEIADKYGVTKSAVAIAWILRHPAGIMPIAGTANPEHLKELCQADQFTLTRQEWYDIYMAEEKPLP